jgi:cell division protein FtsZ
LCAGAQIVFILVGMGGGAGTGAAPVLARAAKESGALVLGVAALPFDFEGGRRRRQAQLGLQQLRAAADAVLCLPNQKLLRMIDSKAGAAECFKLGEALIAEGVRAIRRMLSSPGLINVDMAGLSAATRNARLESVFAVAQAEGEGRADALFEQLMASPLLDGRVLEESNAALVSIVGGPDLTMLEVDRFMGRLNQRLDGAELLFGAAIDPGSPGRMAATLIVSGAQEDLSPPPTPSPLTLESRERLPAQGAPELLDTQLPADRPVSHYVAPPPPLTPEKREQFAARSGGRRSRRAASKLQKELPLDVVSRGRFEKSEPTIRKGEDLDIPTYIRCRLVLN